ncbi:MAG: M15 family peptidase [Actinobacteria bacterium]|nr:M15 family peptidase [Actinomycetota bacterium]
MLLGACAAAPADSESSPEVSVSASAPPTEATSPPAPTPADPEHAVEPPGPLRQSLASADVLVFDPRGLSTEQVAAIRQVEGVTAVERLSLAQVTIEGRVLTVAAVDPATYRRFTLAASAQSQVVWDRVAGGELAVLPGLRRKLPTDERGFVRLGSGADAPQVHVGAYAPQVKGAIDAVVNDAWGKALGITPGNAVLVSTGITAPDRVTKPVQRIVGKDISVQRLDVVERLGLDPQATQTAYVIGTIADAVGTFNYTVLGGGRIAPDPAWVASHIVTAAVPILGSVTCNVAIIPQLRAALEEIVQRGLADAIHVGEYAGCYYPRFIAGTTTLSNHSFGLALDLNVPGNLRGTVGEMDRTVVSIFEKWGFAWGGRWRYTDPMHFELSRLVQPG